MTRAILLILLGLTSIQLIAQQGVNSRVSLQFIFNQDRYAPGDTVWFKAYFLNDDLTPVKGRQFFKLAVTGHTGELLQHFLFAVNGGIGFNQFVFPEGTQPGIYAVTAYDNRMKDIVAFSRQITVVHEKKVLESEQKETDKKLYHAANRLVNVSIDADETFVTRKKAKLAISLVDSVNRPVEGEFTLRVLSDKVESVEPPFIEQLVPSQPWNPAAAGNTSGPDLSKKGTVLSENGTPLPAGTTLVFYLQQNDAILQAFVTAGGKFTFPLRGMMGKDDLIAFAEVRGENVDGLEIVWDEPAVELPLPPASYEGTSDDVYGVFATTKKLIDKSYDFYAASESKISTRTLELKAPLEDRLNGADVTVNVQKYVAFETVSELITEIIPSLQKRVVKGRTMVKVSLREPMAVASADPLYIIDGVVTRSTQYFLSLKPSNIVTVKVVNNPAKLLPLGLIGKNGIVIVETAKRNSRPPVEPWQVVEGLNTPLAFRHQEYTGSPVHRPDLRSTIFWAPTIETDSNGKALVEFTHSDNVGRVRVRVDGLTRDGKAFSGEREFEAVLDR
jgi:hypothetical protein